LNFEYSYFDIVSDFVFRYSYLPFLVMAAYEFYRGIEPLCIMAAKYE
jgi:hypothetical protein